MLLDLLDILYNIVKIKITHKLRSNPYILA